MLTALNLPSSVGHLELCSSDPFAHPKIFLNYYDKAEDLYRMMSSLKLSRKILEEPPLSKY
jgi:choline dehydrogenase-like flavoprotein